MVGDDVGRIYGGQESDFVEGIVFLLGVELVHFDLFDGVEFGLVVVRVNL